MRLTYRTQTDPPVLNTETVLARAITVKVAGLNITIRHYDDPLDENMVTVDVDLVDFHGTTLTVPAMSHGESAVRLKLIAEPKE